MFKTPAEGNGVMGEATAAKKSGRLKNKKFVMIVSFTVLILIAVGAFFVIQALKKPNIAIGTGSEVSGNVEVLSREQQEQVADVWVPVPAFDMDWALAKAVALSTLDRQQEALGVYRSLDMTGKAPYHVYLLYSSAAARANDHTLAASMLTKAIEKLDADSSLDDTEKAILKRRLAGTLEAYKEDTKQ